MNVFSHLHNSSCLSPSCNYQMNGMDIRLGYTNLRGTLGGKRTIRYESISDILISRFSGINKCSQGRNIFVIDFGSSRYQIFVYPAYNVHSDVRLDIHSDTRAYPPLSNHLPSSIYFPPSCQLRSLPLPSVLTHLTPLRTSVACPHYE